MVIAGSLLPGKQKEAIGTFTPYAAAAQGNIRWQHEVFHVTAFGGMALVLGLAAPDSRRRHAGVLLAAAIGVSLELMQTRLTQMGVEWWDVRDDLIAVSIAALLLGTSSFRTAVVRH